MDRLRNVVLEINEDLVSQLKLTTRHESKHFYAHNDNLHRIVWIFDRPAEQLIGQAIEATVARTSYASARLALPEHKGRSHLIVRMGKLAERHWEAIDPQRVLDMSPRAEVTGRKPISPSTVSVRARVSQEVAETFRQLGNGNVSKGIRVAGEFIAQRMQDKSHHALIASAMLISQLL